MVCFRRRGPHACLPGGSVPAMASYFGGIVLARSRGPITAEPAIEYFGIHHVWLRDLGNGWQLLETSHPDHDRFDYIAAARAWCGSTGTPVLAAYVSESHCAAVLAARPDADDIGIHLPDPTKECTAFRHPHLTPSTSSTSEAIGAIATWARSAGLAPDVSHLAWVMAPQPQSETEHGHVSADTLAFELVLALGFPAITPSRTPTVDPTQPPYLAITARTGGLASSARVERIHRTSTGPLDDWVVDAIALDDRIWRAAFSDADDVDIAEIAGDIAKVVEAHRVARQASGPPAKHVTINGREVTSARYLADTMQQMLAGGQFVTRARRDWRPDEHPVQRRATL